MEKNSDFTLKLLEDGTAELRKYTGTAAKVEIPAVISGHTITRIGDRAFHWNQALKEVIIPGTVREIAGRAFEFCTSLVKVNLPESLTVIGNCAFSFCALLEQVLIPEAVTKIGCEAFMLCASLAEINIPRNTVTIGKSAFCDCYHLTKIRVASDHPVFETIDGVLFNNKKKALIFYPSFSPLTEYSIPKGTKIIGSSVFHNCKNLQAVHIPESVQRIESEAFIGCDSIKTIVIPDNVKKIEFRASDKQITLIVIKGSAAEKELKKESCFKFESIEQKQADKDDAKRKNPSKETVQKIRADYARRILEDGTIEIKKYKGVDARVEIPAEISGRAVSRIGDEAFSFNRTAEEVIIPASVSAIGKGCFMCCNALKQVILPTSVSAISERCFDECKSLENIILPRTVISIGDSAFGDCASLRSMHLPESVEAIGAFAFAGCKSLTEINIPSKTVSLDGGVFCGCTSLDMIVISPDHPVYRLVDGVLFNYRGKSLISYPASKKESAYRVPEGTLSIGHTAFGECRRLKSISLPDGLKSIGICAFRECKKLTEINIPDSVTEIEAGAFQGCDLMKKVELPDGLQVLKNAVFRECTNLRDVVIPDSVTRIEDSAFLHCKSLKKLMIPESVMEFERGWIQGGPFDDNITLIVTKGSYAEKYCTRSRRYYYILAGHERPAVFDLNHYAADVFAVSKDREALEETIDYLKGYSVLERITDGIKSVKHGQTELYYFVGKGRNVEKYVKSGRWESNKWDNLMYECRECLGSGGAVIIELTDMQAIEQGNEDLDNQHLSTTPNGKMLSYDTNPLHSLPGRDSGPNEGYDQFVRAFEEAYPDMGKEFISVYERVK